MSENPYKLKIDQLIAGEISELIVPKAEFMSFRDVYLAHPERKKIAGEARLGGEVRYQMIKNQ
ncbi:hypothetical protein ACWN8V_04940 [Vagococcus elongatus]|uniref:Uncharacterized protein n=1 Tax=Vagococcus elongatus TaxID=180344 RepID=A0A430ARP9_9ENTE|nr:hypothetical protein [Vagococcus elongatus]RSU10732.1 hypothetical protein CBF29_09105 [Vagococcus elongatus]